MPIARPILFYDGQCGLCDKLVQWFLKHDLRNAIDFAPLQGATYAALPVSNKPTDLNTVVLFDDHGLHVRSDAVLTALRLIGGIWSPLAAVASIIPLPIRDSIYRFIARHRLAWFGGNDSCTIPSLVDRSRFLP